MADDGAAHEPPAGPIGRVRLDDAAPVTVAPEGAGGAAGPAGDPAAGGWSLAGAGFALLMIAIMIAALVVILWAVFQVKL